MTTWQESDRKRSKGPWIAFAIAVLVIVALAVTLLVVISGRDDTAAPRSAATSSSPSVAPSTNDPGPGLVGAFTDLRFVQVGGVPIPTSPTLGPLTVNTDGTATKYAHSQAGAVVAAIKLIARTSGLVPATVYEPIIANQTVGDDSANSRPSRRPIGQRGAGDCEDAVHDAGGRLPDRRTEHDRRRAYDAAVDVGELRTLVQPLVWRLELLPRGPLAGPSTGHRRSRSRPTPRASASTSLAWPTMPRTPPPRSRC